MKPFNVLTAVAAPLSARESAADSVWSLHGSAYRHAKILVTGTTLGCDADHAALRLADRGIRCVVSSAIEDIFSSSCVGSGILPIALSEPEVQTLLVDAENPESALMTIDLPQQEIVRAGGLVMSGRSTISERSFNFRRGPRWTADTGCAVTFGSTRWLSCSRCQVSWLGDSESADHERA